MRLILYSLVVFLYGCQATDPVSKTQMVRHERVIQGALRNSENTDKPNKAETVAVNQADCAGDDCEADKAETVAVNQANCAGNDCEADKAETVAVNQADCVGNDCEADKAETVAVNQADCAGNDCEADKAETVAVNQADCAGNDCEDQKYSFTFTEGPIIGQIEELVGLYFPEYQIEWELEERNFQFSGNYVVESKDKWVLLDEILVSYDWIGEVHLNKVLVVKEL